MSLPRNTLTARSVLLSVLLGTDPPRLPVQVLVRTTELFGIAEGTTRTALSRMATAGEVVADDGSYALAGRLLARQARQTASRAAHTSPRWDGGWTQAVVGSHGRRRAASDRAAVRSALTGARLAELREGVWLRPDNLGEHPDADADADADGDADGDPGTPGGPGSAGAPGGREGAGGPGGDEVQWFRTFPAEDALELAGRLWDLDGWAARASELQAEMTRLVEPLESGDHRSLRDGFVLSADVLRHFQLDPLLPVELLPAQWPGDALRRHYDRYDAAYRRLLGRWLRGHA